MMGENCKRSIHAVQSGLALLREEKITWKIEGFDVIAANYRLLESQSITFEINAVANIPNTSWKFSFHPYLDWEDKAPKNGMNHESLSNHVVANKKSRKMIEVFYVYGCEAKEEKKFDMIIHKAFCCIRKKDGTIWTATGTDGYTREHKNSPYALARRCNDGLITSFETPIMGFEPEASDLPLNGQTLSIELTIKLYKVDKMHQANFGEDPALQLQRNVSEHFLSLLRSRGESDVVLISKDGGKFPAHKCILRARSDVMNAMLKKDWNEGRTGEIKLVEISSPAVKLLLHYIYSGEVLPYTTTGIGASMNEEQHEGDVDLHFNRLPVAEGDAVTVGEEVDLADILYISQKYGFVDLFNYIDANIVKHCNEENARNLLRLCGLYDLKSKDLVRALVNNHCAILD